jgi:hypothetical protein
MLRSTANNNNNFPWKLLNIIQEISEQNTWKAKHEGNAENGHFGHTAYTS